MVFRQWFKVQAGIDKEESEGQIETKTYDKTITCKIFYESCSVKSNV